MYFRWPGAITTLLLIAGCAASGSTGSTTDQQAPYVAAEAPALDGPSWLVHIEGNPRKIQQGVDQSKNGYLRSTFNTHVPMTQIHSFYLQLLKANDYPAVSGAGDRPHHVWHDAKRVGSPGS